MSATDLAEPDDAPLPPQIGPHEGREIPLMLAGEKPLAYFYGFVGETGIIPDGEFEPHVQDGTFIKREWVVTLPPPPDGRTLPPFRHVLLALPEDAWRIDAAFEIINGYDGDRRRRGEDACVRMGRLLGYSEEAIAVFVRRREAQRRKWQGDERRRRREERAVSA